MSNLPSENRMTVQCGPTAQQMAQINFMENSGIFAFPTGNATNGRACKEATGYILLT